MQVLPISINESCSILKLLHFPKHDSYVIDKIGWGPEPKIYQKNFILMISLIKKQCVLNDKL